MDAWLRRRLALIAGFALFVALLLAILPKDWVGTALVDAAFTTLAAAAAAALAFRRASRDSSPRVWRFIGAGLALTAAGEACWFVFPLLGSEVPSVSLVDTLYYSGYGLLLVGLALWHPAVGEAGAGARRLLDFVVLAVSLALVAWLVVLHKLFDSTASLLEGAVLVGYPLTDIALASAFLLLAREGSRGTRLPVLLVGIGILCWTAADFAYAYLALGEGYIEGFPLSAAWVAGYLLIALAATTPSTTEPAGRPRQALTWLPYAVAAPAFLVFLLDTLVRRHLHGAGDVLLLVLVAGLMGRQFVLLHGNNRQRQLLAFNQERLSGILDSQATLIVRVGTDNRVTYMNEAYRKAFGLKLGDTFWVKIHPDDQAAMQDALQALQQPPHTYALEQRAEVHGEWRSIAWHGSVVRDEEGQIVEYQGVGVDVTDRKRAQADLEAQKSLLEETEAIAHVGSWEIDLATGQQRGTRENHRLFDMAPGEAETRENILRHIHPDDVAAVMAVLERAPRTGREETDTRILLADGSVRWLHTQVVARYDDAGRPVRLVGFSRDVTQGRRAEESLRASEARLKEAQHLARIGSWELDPRTNALWWSDETYRTFGLEPGRRSLTYEFFLSTIHPDDREMVQLAYAKSVAERRPYSIEHRLLLEDGTVKWVHERGQTFYEGGKPVRSIGTTQDITERKAAEETSLRLARLLEDTQRVGGVGSWEIDLVTGAFRGTPEQSRLYGVAHKPSFTAEEALRNVHPDDVRHMQESLPKLVAGQREQVEVRILLPDGGVRWLDVTFKVEGDASGQPVRMVGLSHDVTERKLAEERLQRTADALQEAQATAHLGSWDADLVTGAAHWSDESWAILGLKPGSVQPSFEAFLARVHPDDLDRVRTTVEEALRDGRTVEFETRIVRPDGKVRRILARNVPTLVDGRPVRLSGTNLDVTEAREAEERAREADRLHEAARFKTQFLNMAAHELATPITPLKLQLATARAKLAAGGQLDAQTVDVLERNVNRLGLLVNDLLDAARLQSGRVRLVPRPLDMAAVVNQVFASLADQAAQAGVTLAHSGAEHVTVEADEARLTQVLFNLTHNALKFTPPGGRVDLDVRSEPDAAVVAVRDTGVGLDEAQMARLFQPFVQVHDPSKLKVGGTGLGLYISKGIVEQHGGTLTVASKGPGHGTTFEVRLPLKTPLTPSPPPGA